jgi:hypothetical protein
MAMTTMTLCGLNFRNKQLAVYHIILLKAIVGDGLYGTLFSLTIMHYLYQRLTAPRSVFLRRSARGWSMIQIADIVFLA